MEWDLNESAEWNSALVMPVVRQLNGLRSLRLNIAFDTLEDSAHYLAGDELRGIRLTTGLMKLSTLPLTSAEVFFRVDDLSRAFENSWTETQRTECAQNLKDILLNPQGAEDYAEDIRKEKAVFAREKAEREAFRAQHYKQP